MKMIKKFASIFCAMALISTLFATNVFAATENTSSNFEDTGVAKQMASLQVTEEMSPNSFSEIVPDNFTSKQISGVEKKAITRANWAINDPVFVGNGELTTNVDFYIVSTTAPKTVFLKLASSNSNLIALLYYLKDDGTIGNSTGFGVNANGDDNFGVLPEGKYVIAIGSATGNERGTYSLMWNCANDSGAKRIIDKTSDLARVVLFYDNNKITSNGNNIMNDLVWEEHETWSIPNGYTARDMVIDSITSKGTFIGSFSSSAPYSTNRALFIDVSRGSYMYSNSYYQNIVGDVTHIMDYTDPSGLKTPRTLGEAPTDFNWGDHYIVIDLNNFSVVEFLSPFNYHYTEQGGRTYTLSNIISLN